ncbi:hypothetical protein MKK70_05845 [Methylobacterium sp. E-041]|uniref:DUF6894 family protein n=1 Tax=Methylobacterium sp. E-041 TaxID=2836573 RepID=UPI001FBB3E10|nr:hypothetical protein [Methylobacterium sp. E-041]MCJ2104909.1 hypothetical protein [Methylobacterium sp. E-041]
MARYFFDFYDGKMHRDAIGHECKGHDDVRLEAMHALPAIARDKVPEDGNEQAYTVLVRSERNLTVYTATLTFAGIWLGEDEPPTEEQDD